MKFSKLTVQNFFSYAKEQELDLTGNGIWSISASNGSGKTTISIEALTFAIYGKTRCEKIDDCVNRYIGKNCKVHLQFLDGQDVYDIFRYRKHDTHKNNVYLFKNNTDISCKNASDTNALIEEKIGLTYLAFINSTVFSSELYSNFLSATGADRLAIFENILSLKEVTLFYTKTKEIIGEKNDILNEAKLRFTEKATELKMLQNQVDDYKQSSKEKLLKIKIEKEAAEKAKSEIEEKINEFSSIDINLEKQKNASIPLLQEYNSQLEKASNDLSLLKKPDSVSTEREIIEKYQDVDFDKNKKLETEYNENKKIFDSLSCELVNLKSDFKIYENKLQERNNEINKLQVLIFDEYSNLDKIKENICPFCGQSMDEQETIEKRKIIDKKIQELENSKNQLESQDFSELNNSAKIAEVEEKIKSIVLNNDFIENADLIQEKYNNALKMVEKFDQEMQEYNSKKMALEENISSLENSKNQVVISKYSNDELDEIESKINSLKDELTDQEKILTSVKARISEAFNQETLQKLENQVSDKNTEFQKNVSEVQDIEQDIDYYNVLLDCFSNKSQGFKKYFIGEMISLFNEKVNQFLPFFFSEKVEINFDQNLVDTIMVDGVQVSFKSFSCGQKTRAELSVAFALFSVARLFFANDGGLLVVDEIFDRGLDSAGISSGLSVLDGFANDCKIFIVSHNPNVKEKIDNVIEIRKDENGFSYIK